MTVTPHDANRVDHARCLEAENGFRGKREYGLDIAPADLRIGGADPGSLDSDPHLTGAWLGQRYVPPDEDVWRSIPGENDGFRHRRTSKYVACWTVTMAGPMYW